ncbi:MAG TPA: SH3 domain-containing protein [Caulobacteraceae bacterium]|jgi:curli biogenesis system outer membrane secretion channel CsgG
MSAKFWLLAAGALMVASSAHAQAYGTDNKRPAGTPDLPKCQQPIGTVSIVLPENQWWLRYNLGSPEALIKLYAQRSNCLRVVDRGAGLAVRNAERNLGAGGELQRGSNVGAGQIKAADYTIVPDIADANQNAGGGAAALGGFIPGPAGAILGGIRTKSSTAHVLLNLVNVRTTEQEYTAEGTAQKTNISFAGGGFGGLIGGVAGGYSNTDIGQIIAAAYLNAYVDLVGHMQGMVPGGAQAAAPIQTYVIKQNFAMRASASATAKIVRQFQAGDSVFPTGQKNGVWWEVDDETGNRGWVSSVMITAK